MEWWEKDSVAKPSAGPSPAPHGGQWWESDRAASNAKESGQLPPELISAPAPTAGLMGMLGPSENSYGHPWSGESYAVPGRAILKSLANTGIGMQNVLQRATGGEEYQPYPVTEEEQLPYAVGKAAQTAAVTAPLVGAAAGAVGGSGPTMAVAKGLGTTLAIRGLESVTGIKVPWWLEVPADIAAGGSGTVQSARSLGKKMLVSLLKGEFAPAAKAAAPRIASEAEKLASEGAIRGVSEVASTLPANISFTIGSAIPEAKALAEAAPEVAKGLKVISAKVGKDTGYAVIDATENGVRFFRDAKAATEFAQQAKRAVKVAETAKEAVQSAPSMAQAAESAPAMAEAAKAAPAVASVVQAPQAAMAAIQRFAKEAAGRNPKLGEKIWIALDKVGNPVRILTPDQAGAAKRAGFATTWIRNIWQ